MGWHTRAPMGPWGWRWLDSLDRHWFLELRLLRWNRLELLAIIRWDLSLLLGKLSSFFCSGSRTDGMKTCCFRIEVTKHDKSSRLPEGSRFRLQGGDSNCASPMWNLHLSSLYNPILNLDPCFSIFLIHFMCLACTYFSAKKQVVEQSWQHLLLPRNQSLHFSRIPINGAFKSFFRVHL